MDGNRIRMIAVALLAVMFFLGCSRETATTEADRIALGRRIFHDTSLSADGRISCASCHIAERLFSDGRTVSIGVHGRPGTRNAPSVLDLQGASHLFWDGRESQLDRAVLQPFTNPVEMGLRDLDQLVEKLRDDPAYDAPGIRDHGSPHADDTLWIATALHAYLRTLRSPASRFQRHLEGGNVDPLSSDELQGLALFRGKAECAGCHRLEGARPSLTDQNFHHTGVGFEQVAGGVAPLTGQLERLSERKLAERILSDRAVAELGRFAVTRRPQDLGAFRTPSLYNVAETAPYMHDGSIATLQEAVEREIYYRSLARGRPISLTVEEQRQIVAFLHTLSAPSRRR